MLNKESQQFFNNYDLADEKTGPGTGFYANLDKYKSVSDFRKKKMKRRKKMLENIRNHKLDKIAFDNPYQDIADPTIYDSDEPTIHPLGGVADKQQLTLDMNGNPIVNMLTQVRDADENEEVISEVGTTNQEPNFIGITPNWQTEIDPYYENKFRGIMDPSDSTLDRRLIK
jgi:hypothetical protein